MLQERYEDYLAKTGGRGGPAEVAAKEAVQAAFRHAAALNAHALVAGGCGQEPLEEAQLFAWSAAMQGYGL